MARRLAAILAADVVGYSRLLKQDQPGTLAALRTVRADVIDPQVATHAGTTIKNLGDGWIIEFASVADAVGCAVAIQQGLAGHALIRLRIGVHIGDVVFENEDVFGDGVNVAARLEAIAEPASVLISDLAHASLDEAQAAQFSDTGKHELKNITRPVQAWQWQADQPVAANPTQSGQPKLPDKPSIAILPFDNMSGDPEQEYFADGVAEDIITALSRSRDLFVIARNSSFAYRGTSVDVRKVAQELGVHYVLEGSVRRAGDRIRVTAQLIEAATGAHVWADRYDRPLTDIFAVQDEITQTVAGAIGGELRAYEGRRTAQAPDEELQVWEKLRKADWLLSRHTLEDISASVDLSRRILSEHGENAAAYALLSFALSNMTQHAGNDRPAAELLLEAREAAQKSVKLDPENDAGFSALGIVLWWLGQHDDAMAASERAVELNPNSSSAHANLGYILGFSGPDTLDRGAAEIDMAMRLAPNSVSSPIHHAIRAMLETLRGDYTAALRFAREGLKRNPGHALALRGLAVPLALTGQADAARTAWEESMRESPFEPAAYVQFVRTICRRPEDSEILVGSIRDLGIDLPD